MDSFGKRQRERRKLEKRESKAARHQERLASSSSVQDTIIVDDTIASNSGSHQPTTDLPADPISITSNRTETRP